jgi:hypothetical protein
MGVPIHNVQAHTGHARASTLLDIYGHAMKSGNEMIPQKLAEAIAPHLEQNIQKQGCHNDGPVAVPLALFAVI